MFGDFLSSLIVFIVVISRRRSSSSSQPTQPSYHLGLARKRKDSTTKQPKIKGFRFTRPRLRDNTQKKTPPLEFKACLATALSLPHQTLKHPTWWWWWSDFSLSIIPWTYLNSSTWQGIVIVPFWSNPYSSSASLSSCMNNGWLKYNTGTTNLCCSAPCPTLIAKHPFGTSLITCFFPWWRRCKWKFLKLFSPLPIFRTKQNNWENKDRQNPNLFFFFYLTLISEKLKSLQENERKGPRVCCDCLLEERKRRISKRPGDVGHGW